jgi:hypothetical protein
MLVYQRVMGINGIKNTNKTLGNEWESNDWDS